MIIKTSPKTHPSNSPLHTLWLNTKVTTSFNKKYSFVTTFIVHISSVVANFFRQNCYLFHSCCQHEPHFKSYAFNSTRITSKLLISFHKEHQLILCVVHIMLVGSWCDWVWCSHQIFDHQTNNLIFCIISFSSQ